MSSSALARSRSIWVRKITSIAGVIAVAATFSGCDVVAPDAGSVVVIRSVDGTIGGVVGKSQTLHLKFAAVGATSLTDFTIKTGLDALPAGWNGPSSFSCSTIGVGSSCEFDLVFAPTKSGSGAFTLGYTYKGTAGVEHSGSIGVDYSAAAANAVQVNVSPVGQVNAILGTGTQTVTVAFTTNDGSAATAFAVTSDLSSLPPGWSSASSSFACSQVTTGNGCQLQLSYAPSVVGSGKLALNYRYDDNAGIARTASVSVDYASTSHNNLTATASPTGQIGTTLGAGSQTVRITFTTDDGNSASDVAVSTNLAALPAGWSSVAPTFACAAASTGNTCQLSLTYAPITTGSGTLTLNYTYNDNSGAAQLGQINIPYVATANNNVVGSVSPSGQITIAAGASASPTVTFTTDDANPATAFSVTTNLSALPSGWSGGASSLTCATVQSGNGCQLSLTYAPSSAGSGTLQINYSYTNNAGTAKTGSVSIPYVATAPHIYIGQLVSVVETCALNSSGLLSGCVSSGVNGDAVTISGNRIYIGDYGNNILRTCAIAVDGSLTGCATTGSNYFYPFVMTVSGNFLYAASASSLHTIMYCPIQSDGTVATCAETGLNGGEGLNSKNGYFYISRPHDGAGKVYVCQQAVDGTLSNCVNTGSGFSQTEDIAISGNFAFVANTGDATISTCTISGSDGTLSGCFKSALAYGPMGIAIYNSRAYVSTRNGNVYVCDVNGTTGALTNCVVSNGGSSLGLSVQVAIHP